MRSVKIISLSILILLLSSLFAFAQETDDVYDEEAVVEECNFGCKIWQFLFGSKEARAGKAWSDRSEALVGEGVIYLGEVKISAAPALPAVAESFDANKIKNFRNLLKEDGIEGTFNGKKGTFTLNDDGTKFFFQERDKDKVEVRETDLLQTKFGGKVSTPVDPPIDQVAATKLQQSLTSNVYKQFAESLGKVTTIYSSDGKTVMEGPGGTITVSEENGLQVAVRYSSDGKTFLDTSIVKNGHVLVKEDAQARIIVEETAYNYPEGKPRLHDRLNELITTGIELPGKEGEPSGLLKLTGDVFTAVDYEKESMQRINTKSRESERLNIDYYREGSSGCKTEGGCFVATGGEAVLPDASGKAQRYLVDYEYKGTGADRAKPENLEEVEYFNPLTGNQEGAKFKDKTQIMAQKDEKGKYTGEYSFTTSDGTTANVQKAGDTWQPTGTKVREIGIDYLQAVDDVNNLNGKTADEWLSANDNKLSFAEKEAKSNLLALGEALKKAQEDDNKVSEEANKEENKKRIEAIESSSQGSLAGARGVIQSIYSITNNIKSYPAISNLLFGDADFFKKWRAQQDAAFAPLLGENLWNSAICEVGFNHWKDLQPEGKAVIKTPSGTYQAVASIQMERSPETSPILCHKNPDEESEELFICGGKQVCVDESFCYADQDQDDEPDSKEPLKGYFYKVTWAVSAPQDEAFTPLVDENGVAVSFNVFLYPGTVPMYNLDGNIASPIQLQNGDRDKDAIIKYSTQAYDKACIVWNQAPLTAGSLGGAIGGVLTFGAADARKSVGEVCFNVVTSSIGQVNWERSGQEAASVTVSHGEVSRNTEW